MVIVVKKQKDNLPEIKVSTTKPTQSIKVVQPQSNATVKVTSAKPTQTVQAVQPKATGEIQLGPPSANFIMKAKARGANYTQIVDEMVKRGGRDAAFIEAARAKGANATQIATEILKRNNIAQTSSKPAEPKSLSNRVADRIIEDATDTSSLNPIQVGIGAGKTILKQINNASKVLGNTVGRVGNFFLGKGFTPSEPAFNDAALEQKGLGQTLGGLAVETGEFIAGSGPISTAQTAINAAIKGKSLLSALGRLSGKAVAEAAGTGAIRFAQTGSLEQAREAATFAGGFKAATGAVGETFKAFGVPEYLYSKIFKTSKTDMLQYLRSFGNQQFAKSNPQEFNNLVRAGFLQVDDAGKVAINETLAKEALDRGLRGNVNDLAQQIVNITNRSEAAARQLTANYTAPITLNTNLVKALHTIVNTYDDVGTGQIAQKASSLLDDVSGNKTSASTALEIRRFLDGFRIRSSFEPSTHLSLQQRALKELTDELRSQINDIPGMSNVMNDYRFSIEALDDLAAEAARRNNREMIGFVDSIMFGSGSMVSPVAGPAAFIGRRVLNSPSALTNIGTNMNAGVLTKTGAATKSILINGGQLLLSQRQQKQ